MKEVNLCNSAGIVLIRKETRPGTSIQRKPWEALSQGVSVVESRNESGETGFNRSSTGVEMVEVGQWTGEGFLIPGEKISAEHKLRG